MDNNASRINPVAAREVIRSLENGVVPSTGYALFSRGRERWINSLDMDLSDLADSTSSAGRLRLVNGRNGDGKTHLMHMLKNLALERGFAVSYVVISADVPLYKWDRVYAKISRSITLPSGRIGLRQLFNPRDPAPEIADSFRDKSKSTRGVSGLDPDFATALYRYTTEQTVNVDHDQDMHLLGSWLEGYPTGVLRSFGISSIVDKNNGSAILRSLVRALRHFGVPGLLIMVDEVESVLSLNVSQRRDSYQTLRLLVDGSSTAAHSFFVASTTPPMFTDIDRGLPTYPALWSRIKPSERPTVNYHGAIIDLTRTPLTTADYSHIAQAIAEIFSVGWDGQNNASTLSTFFEAASKTASDGRLTMTFSPTRVFVKLVVEMLVAAFDCHDLTNYGDMPQAFGRVDEQLVRLQES